MLIYNAIVNEFELTIWRLLIKSTWYEHIIKTNLYVINAVLKYSTLDFLLKTHSILSFFF